MILRLEDVPPNLLGGKGLGLARLIALDLPVPPTAVIPAGADSSPEDPQRLLDHLGEPLAVRSSAIGEDAADRSAAGMYESVMGVTRQTLSDAIDRVLASGRSERVRAYRGGTDAPMAVIVQREISTTKAGVAFSRDPLTGSDDVFVECLFGHGERLVSGASNPDRFWVTPAGVVTARLGVKDEPYRLVRTLRDDEARDVADLTRRAADGFGRPVDVEFCFERRKLWLVQCRPITTLATTA
ncbi:MAG TPA: PEP/pyruvate-binding domain-containing protein [Actinomycetota bacterium]|nr:PEP/pyruvate-binding domain-containing protein [Actinomycetota bacterium]